jgi:hypothetical protein
MKHIIFLREGIKFGSVRTPLPELIEADMQTVVEAAEMISKQLRIFSIIWYFDINLSLQKRDVKYGCCDQRKSDKNS